MLETKLATGGKYQEPMGVCEPMNPVCCTCGGVSSVMPAKHGEFNGQGAIARWIRLSERWRLVFNGWPVALRLVCGIVGTCSMRVRIEACAVDGDDANPFNLVRSNPFTCDSLLIPSIDLLIGGIALKLFVCS